MAGAAAAAVIAAAVITAHQFGGSDRNTDSGSVPPAGSTGTVIVEVTDMTGGPVRSTITAPMTTVGTSVMAITIDADGAVRQVPVLGVVPSGESNPAPATTEPSAAATTSATPVATPSTPSSPAGGAVLPSVRNTDARPGRDTDTATVLPGTAKLTGWIPLSTPPGG